jgi:ABC-type transport system involved in multi-copper enzyme maturation permease subunit
MRQFVSVLRWEIAYYLRRVSTWIYFAIYAAIGFLFMLLSGGAFSEAAAVFGGGGKVLANAPFALASLLPTIALCGMSIVAAVAGNAIYRDYDARMESLVYTTPISKPAFLGGRFVGTLVVNAIILLGIVVGLILASKTPWVKADKFGPFHLWAYLQPFCTLVLPNLLFTASIFFALPAVTRQMVPNYVGGVLLLLGYLMGGQLLSDLTDKYTGALLDPFGIRALQVVTEYWPIADRNSRYVPLTGALAANRAIWIVAGLAVFAAAYLRFRFSYAASDPHAKAATATPPLEALAPVPRPVRTVDLPAAARHFDLRGRLIQFWSMTTRSFWRVVRNPYFYAITGAGILYMLLVVQQIGKIYGTETWPVTYKMVEILNGSFGLFLLVIIAFYAGELVWAERDVKMAQIADTMPVPNVTAFAAKFTALMAVLVLLLAVVMLTGIATQAFSGYTHFELPLYLEALFGFRLLDLLLLAVLAMAVHVIVNHKYLGHLIVFVLFIGLPLLGQFGFERNLYQYGSDGGLQYSDMNRWGPFAHPFVYWKLYWFAFAILLAVLTNLLWVRGEETHARWRAHLARVRFGAGARGVTTFAGLSFLGLGGFLYYNTDVLNHFTTSSQRRHIRAEYEKRYKKYDGIPQPRITGVQIQVDLVPERGDMRVRGHYVLRNKTAVPIDTVHLRLDRDLDVKTLSFDRPSRVVTADTVHEYYMHQLARPLAPGDSLLLDFDFARVARGFGNTVSNTDIASNGTFVENGAFMPSIGYESRAELADDDDRKKEKLPPQQRMKAPTDSTARATNYVSADADWLDYDATVSTAPDQIAITSGYLQKEWLEGGRRYFHYKMDSPIVNLWAFQSARYATASDKWTSLDGKVVDIVVYYHPTHRWNVERMISAVKKSLDYYTQNFGPYQHHQVRIVEFPRYATFAQSLPNTIPYSEAIGFVARVEKPDDIDYPFYVTAHEVAHQWWAHQVIGANARGATLLSETLAQYSALMVMEKEYGAASMRRFLEYELDRYLVGRSTERKRELPLALNENQDYIHYRKGSLVMYALRDYIGEAKMNAAIRGFLNAEKFRGPPYPTSLELVDSLRSATPDSLRYLIKDMFETITLYELKADSAIATDNPSGGYRLDLYVTSKKLRADSLGAETPIAMHDWVDIGVYRRPVRGERTPDKDGVPISLGKQLIRDSTQHIVLTTTALPSRAGIDPLHKLISRLTTQNTIGVQDRTKRKRPPLKARRLP